MAKVGTTLKKISSDQLDKILSQVLVEKQSKLVLLGSGIALDNWPDALQDSDVIYQLTETVDNLADKILPLTNLHSLIFRGNKIGDAGAKALACPVRNVILTKIQPDSDVAF